MLHIGQLVYALESYTVTGSRSAWRIQPLKVIAWDCETVAVWRWGAVDFVKVSDVFLTEAEARAEVERRQGP